MPKRMMTSVILISLLSGCDVAHGLAVKPTAERVTRASLKREPAPVQVLPTRAPQGDASRTPAASAPSPAATARPQATPTPTTEATVPADRTASPAAETGTTRLKSVQPAESPSVIRVLGADGKVADLQFLDQVEAQAWEVETTRGAAALPLARVKVELTPAEWYPLAEEFLPEGVTIADLIASDAVASESARPAEEPPLAISEHTPTELGWPAAIAPATTETLAFDLGSPRIATFLDDYPGLSRFTLRVTLLDAAGEALKNELDKPVVLESSIRVL